MMNRIFLSLMLLVFLSCNKETEILIVATNDVHGRFFSMDYKDDIRSKTSLENVSSYVKKLRAENGKIILVDVGDHIQGDDAAFYYNYIETEKEHLFATIMNYMDYDAVVVGNHDIEAGPAVYDKLKKDLEAPYLAANAILDGKPYFEPYVIKKINGLKVAIIGMTNPGIPGWLSKEMYGDIHFEEIPDISQKYINHVRENENPDIVILAIHAGIGNAEYFDENPGYYLASTLQGVDIILSSHDHRIFNNKIFNGVDSTLLIEAGNRCEHLSQIKIIINEHGDKIINGDIVELSIDDIDEDYMNKLSVQYEEVKAYSNREIGILSAEINMSKSLHPFSDAMAVIHKIQLNTGVDISITAPLTLTGIIKKGPITQNDLFTLYKYENTLVHLEMSGSQLKEYLERVYDDRINKRGPYYNYDSAAGIDYIVNSVAPKGRRVKIVSFADGKAFDENKNYKVAFNSYRVNGGGGHLEAIGISEDKILAELGGIRELLHEWIIENKGLNLGEIWEGIGSWYFVK